MNYGLGDVVKMKKKHPCGSDEWEIWRMGMDIGIKCCGCGRKVMIPRRKFEKSAKKIVSSKQNDNLEKTGDK